MKTIAAMCLALTLAGCGAEPIATAKTGTDSTAELIAKVDGCNLWRIWDGGRTKFYFARCPEGARGTAYWESYGKSGSSFEQVVADR